MTVNAAIFAPWPSFSKEEADIVSRVLLSNKVNYWTGGEGRAFEREFAEHFNCKHAIAVANGTLALDLALHAFDIGHGDEVVVTPRSFMASASCVVNAGATPIFADVDARSQNITAETIAPVLSDKTRAIICVHHAGWPCDMDPIIELAEERGIKVIEDCAQAHGALYRGRPVGGIGHIGCFSFCQDKIITTGGEGGMVTTNDDGLWHQMWSFKDHGKNWHAVFKRDHAPGFRWVHESFGSNFRLTEMQAALGRHQLDKLPEWHQTRRRNAEALMATLQTLDGLDTPVPEPDIENGWYRLYTFVRPEALKDNWTQLRVMEEINAGGVPCFVGSCPEIYLEKAFDNARSRPLERLPVARQLGETSLAFLVHPTLTADNIETTKRVVSAVMERATA